MKIAKGSVIFKKNDESKEMYVVMSGKCNIKQNRKTISLTTKTKNGNIPYVLGELSHISHVIRPATAIAQSDVAAFIISYDSLVKNLKSNKSTTLLFYQNLTQLIIQRFIIKSDINLTTDNQSLT